MLLDVDYIKNTLVNENLVDIYLSMRVRGETVRSIAMRHNIDASTVHDKWVRACHHISDELKRELARTEYQLGKYRTRGIKDWGNVPTNIFYVNGSTHKDTFTIPCIRTFVLAHCHGLVLDAFAGTTKLQRKNCQFVTNDINVECKTNFNVDCTSTDFADTFKNAGFTAFDTILIDPPFSVNLARRKYEGRWCRDFTLAKNNIDKLSKIGTKIISLGFNSTGMGSQRGYEKLELMVVNCKGNNNDILVLVERKIKIIDDEQSFNLGVVEDGEIA